MIVEGKYFKLDNGYVLRTIIDLFNKIPDIDDIEFEKHIANNEFINWIKNVFNENELANKLAVAKNKQQYSWILKRYYKPLENAEIINKTLTEKTVIRLENGDIIRTIEDLYNTIPKVNESILQKHIASGIFANWVKNVIGNIELGDKLIKAKDKQEFWSILKEYHDSTTDIEKVLIKKENREVFESQKIEQVNFKIEFDLAIKKFKELTDKISKLRKEGKDTYLANLRLMNFKSKIYIAKTTRDNKDLNTAKQILVDAEQFLKGAIEEKLINVKQEVNDGAKKLIENIDINNAHINPE